MENINLTVEESYTDDDLKYLREIFCNPDLTKSDIVQAYENNDIVQIARLFELSNGIWYDNEYVG